MKVTRRDFVKGGLLGFAGVWIGGVRKASADDVDPYGRYRMGVQSFCFRKFSLLDALDKTHELGLKYIEVYPGHMPNTLPDDKLDEIRAKAKSLGITVDAYGVVGLGKNKEKDRSAFAFLKKMGI